MWVGLNTGLRTAHTVMTEGKGKIRVFHVNLMFLHKPLFTLRNEEKSPSRVRVFITLEGEGRRMCGSLAGCSFQLHSD